MIPIFHCKIGVGNQLLEKLCDITNEHIEIYAPGEELTRSLIPVLKQIIADTAKLRDDWDAYVDGKQWKKLTRTVAAYCTRVAAADANPTTEHTHSLDKIKLQELHNFCKRHFANKLKRACKKMNDQQLKLKGLRAAKVRDQKSIETSMFKVLKEIGVELSAYHGGSLNGKDIKRVMNNASHVFDQFAEIFKEGKRPDCLLSDDDIDTMCLHFREVFVL
jgi:hypothetical protein